MLAGQGAADEDAQQRFGQVEPTARERGEEHHDAVREQPEQEIGGVVAGQVIPPEQQAQRRELRRQGTAGPQARLPARPLRTVVTAELAQRVGWRWPLVDGSRWSNAADGGQRRQRQRAWGACPPAAGAAGAAGAGRGERGGSGPQGT